MIALICERFCNPPRSTKIDVNQVDQLAGWDGCYVE